MIVAEFALPSFFALQNTWRAAISLRRILWPAAGTAAELSQSVA